MSFALPPELAKAAIEPVRLTVTELLALFGERNRDFEIVGRIEQILSDHGLHCRPELSDRTLPRNAPVVVRSTADDGQESVRTDEPGRPSDAEDGRATGSTGSSGSTGQSSTEEDETEAESDDESVVPAALRICDVPSADLRGGLVSAHPGEDLSPVRTRMMLGNFSQLPVLSSPHVLTGVVSWKSIALAHTRGVAETLKNVTQTEGVPVVRIDADLLACIPDIYESDYVFVQRLDYTFCGIVTAADLSSAFGNLTGPYLRLGEIERRLRGCVDRMCSGTVEDLREATGFKKARSTHDLTLGQIERVFRDPDRWKRLGWGIEHDAFVGLLESVRRTRNDVAHFRPDPIRPEQREQLYAFAGWLKDLAP